MTPSQPLKASAFMRPFALLYFYRRRLRVHGVQELLAGVGVAIAVALVFAATTASHSIAGSASEVVHAVIGPASLQIRARRGDGFDERLFARVRHLPGVRQAAPILEQSATIRARNGHHVTVDLAGANTSLVVLDGLAHTLPIATLAPGGLGLSSTTASVLGLASTGSGLEVSVELRGRAIPIRVSAVLGGEAFGALAQARVAVMPLNDLQRLAGLEDRISRILIQPEAGRGSEVRAELRSLLGERLSVSAANQDVAALREALRPSNQSSYFFAAISTLLGFLFAFTALLLTVPERRQAVSELRMSGTRHTAIIQMFAFQAVVLGTLASLVGLLGGYLLSIDVFHQSTGYLAEAFTLSTHTVVAAGPVVLAFLGGLVATCLASAIPLLDLRRGRTLDGVYGESGVPGNALSARTQQALGVSAGGLLALSSVIFVLAPELALLACALLAFATVCVVPLALVAVLRSAGMVTERYQRLTILSVALSSLRGTTLRSLALAGTGAVALFGSVALGGARGDLLRGIGSFAQHYSADATIWVSNPDDNQATNNFVAPDLVARIGRVPGVAAVEEFQGGFLELGAHPPRRVWVIARPPEADREVLRSQISSGNADTAIARLAEGGWVVLSKQLAELHHTAIGGTVMLPTPSGEVRFKLAGTTTNLAWTPGVVFIDSSDYRRLWATVAATALGVSLRGGVGVSAERAAILATLGPSSGLEVSTAASRQARIDALTSEGLGQLGEISTMLEIAAILALAAAVTSAMWQGRISLAGLRLSGVGARRLRRILLVEAVLILSAGCITGALTGVYGQLIIDSYLQHVTGFPVANLSAGLRPFEIFAAVILAVLAIVSVPGWFASRVSPGLALNA